MNNLAFSNAKLKAKEKLFELEKGNICQIVCPSDYIEKENDGFFVKDLTNGNYCYVTLEKMDELKEIEKLYEFPVIEWSNFFEQFDIVEE